MGIPSVQVYVYMDLYVLYLILCSYIIICFLVAFSNVLSGILLSSLHILYLSPSCSLTKATPFFHSPPLQIICTLLSLSHLSPLSWSHFTVLDSAITPGYVLTSEDLALRTADGREHVVFVLLVLVTSLTMIFDSSSFTCKFHDFIFIFFYS